MRRFHVIFKAPVLSATLALGAGDAEAQAAEQDTTPRLSKVTITATRSPVSVLRVPLAVTIVGRSQLAISRGYGFDDALNLVPGVFAQSRSGNQDARITIRGFGARGAGDRSNAGTSRGIRVLIDGFPETEPDGRTAFDGVDLATTERIDVVRSNASATWGNAAGGVLNLTTMPEVQQSMLSAAADGRFVRNDAHGAAQRRPGWQWRSLWIARQFVVRRMAPGIFKPSQRAELRRCLPALVTQPRWARTCLDRTTCSTSRDR